MTPHEASAELERMIEGVRAIGANWEPRTELALTIAGQALDILATLEEHLHLNEPVTIESREFEWRVTRSARTHLGSDLTDALGQLCQTLAME